MSLLRKFLLLPQGGGGGAKLVTPSANSSFDMIGKVDIREYAGSFDRNPGTGVFYMGDGGLGEPVGWGGSSFDRA